MFFIAGEYHGNNPEMSKLLHKAVRQKSENAYFVYQQHLANRPVNVSFLSFSLRILQTETYLFTLCCLLLVWIFLVFCSYMLMSPSILRFFVIFLSSKVIGHLFLLGKLNRHPPLSSVSALVECLLELFPGRHMKQLQ